MGELEVYTWLVWGKGGMGDSVLELVACAKVAGKRSGKSPGEGTRRTRDVAF